MATHRFPRWPFGFVDRLLNAPTALAVAVAALPLVAAVVVFGVLQATTGQTGGVTTLVRPADPGADAPPTGRTLTGEGPDPTLPGTTTPTRSDGSPPPVSDADRTVTTPGLRTTADGPPRSSAPQAPAVPFPPPASTPAPSSPDPSQADPLSAYAQAGYGDAEARLLMHAWDVRTLTDAKVAAGRLLVSGGTLPVRPGDTPGTVSQTFAAAVFAHAGYRRPQAQVLARGWRSPNADVATSIAGRRILRDLPLPIRPRDTAQTAPARFARIAFHNAGYGDQHVEPLMDSFPGLTRDQTRIAAGRVILHGRTLPVPPG